MNYTVPSVFRRVFLSFFVMFLALSLSARGADDLVGPTGSESPEIPVIRLLVPSGATLATVALLEDRAETAGYLLELEVAKSPDLIAARIISGECDFAVIPTNLAATLANKGTGIRMAGPAIWGLLYVVTSEDLSSISDLKGRTVNMIGRGLTPDITFRHLLQENGLEPDVDVTLTYASGAAELAPAFLTGRSSISMMPEPMITTVLSRKPDTRILLDVQSAWKERYGASYPQAGLVVAGAFADGSPGITEEFISDFATSVSAAVADPAAAGTAAAVLAPEMDAGIFAEAVPRMNLSFVDARSARGALEDYYRVLEAFNPVTIGGTLPPDEFYLP